MSCACQNDIVKTGPAAFEAAIGRFFNPKVLGSTLDDFGSEDRNSLYNEFKCSLHHELELGSDLVLDTVATALSKIDVILSAEELLQVWNNALRISNTANPHQSAAPTLDPAQPRLSSVIESFRCFVGAPCLDKVQDLTLPRKNELLRNLKVYLSHFKSIDLKLHHPPHRDEVLARLGTLVASQKWVQLRKKRTKSELFVCRKTLQGILERPPRVDDCIAVFLDRDLKQPAAANLPNFTELLFDLTLGLTWGQCMEALVHDSAHGGRLDLPGAEISKLRLQCFDLTGRCLDRTRFFLMVRSALFAGDLLRLVPQKICTMFRSELRTAQSMVQTSESEYCFSSGFYETESSEFEACIEIAPVMCKNSQSTPTSDPTLSHTIDVFPQSHIGRQHRELWQMRALQNRTRMDHLWDIHRIQSLQLAIVTPTTHICIPLSFPFVVSSSKAKAKLETECIETPGRTTGGLYDRIERIQSETQKSQARNYYRM